MRARPMVMAASEVAYDRRTKPGAPKPVQHPEKRKSRTRCSLEIRDGDDRSVVELKRLLMAGWAAFVRDCDLKIVEDA